MKLNKLYNLLMILGISLGLSGCFNEPGTEILLGESVVAFEDGSTTLLENEGSKMLTVQFSKAPTSDVTVSYTVTATGATEGVDFTVVSPNPLTVSAGSYSASIEVTAIDNSDFEPDPRSFVIAINTVSDASYLVESNVSVSVTLINDDCPANTSVWFGNLSSLDVGYSTYTGTGEGTGTCNELFIETDLIGGGVVAKIPFTFTPASPGATNGTLEATQQDYCCADGDGIQYQYKASGTYDEVTEVINLSYEFFRRDGSVWWTGSTVIQPN